MAENEVHAPHGWVEVWSGLSTVERTSNPTYIGFTWKDMYNVLLVMTCHDVHRVLWISTPINQKFQKTVYKQCIGYSQNKTASLGHFHLFWNRYDFMLMTKQLSFFRLDPCRLPDDLYQDPSFSEQSAWSRCSLTGLRVNNLISPKTNNSESCIDLRQGFQSFFGR